MICIVDAVEANANIDDSDFAVRYYMLVVATVTMGVGTTWLIENNVWYFVVTHIRIVESCWRIVGRHFWAFTAAWLGN